jgi:aminobenzoyl-glutamate transport protein
MSDSKPAPRKRLMFRFLDWVEWAGNRLPHPFWLFCYLTLAVALMSDVMPRLGVIAMTPEAQILQTEYEGSRIDGRRFKVSEGFQPFSIQMEQASYSSRLRNIFVEVSTDHTVVYERALDRSELRRFEVSRQTVPPLQVGRDYLIKFVSRSEEIRPRSLISREGLNWFVLHMVENFAHFEPLGLVLVMLMGVAIAEGSGLIPTVMRGVAMSVPERLITPAVFALAACGNVGSDAGIVVIPPLAAAIFRQLGRNPIVGLLVGYAGATAGFTANMLPAGTDVLAMSLTNAATGNNPEINVLSNWYFMSASVLFLAVAGTFVTNRYVAPRLGSALGGEPVEINPLTSVEKKGIAWAIVWTIVAVGIWMLTILPENGLLRDPNPNLFWRSNFFKGLVPVLFSLFTVGGVAFGIKTRSIKCADDVVGYMSEAMKRMGPFIVLVLVMAQFIRIFQFARLDQIIAIRGAEWLRAVGFEDYPIPFFIAFVLLIALANLFMGSASAKWAIFAPIFVPMFLSLGFYPAFTQLLYRIGDSITNCVSPLYPYFPLLLGWIAQVDKSKAKVGTVLSLLIPYANFLLIGWVIMLIIWYVLGLPVGPDSPILLNG